MSSEFRSSAGFQEIVEQYLQKLKLFLNKVFIAHLLSPRQLCSRPWVPCGQKPWQCTIQPAFLIGPSIYYLTNTSWSPAIYPALSVVLQLQKWMKQFLPPGPPIPVFSKHLTVCLSPPMAQRVLSYTVCRTPRMFLANVAGDVTAYKIHPQREKTIPVCAV